MEDPTPGNDAPSEELSEAAAETAEEVETHASPVPDEVASEDEVQDTQAEGKTNQPESE